MNYNSFKDTALCSKGYLNDFTCGEIVVNLRKGMLEIM